MAEEIPAPEVSPSLENIRKLYETVPDVFVSDDGIIHHCPLRSCGRAPNPNCMRTTHTRRDNIDMTACVGQKDEELIEKRIPLPSQEKTQKAFSSNRHISVDKVGTIFFDYRARLKERIAMYAQPVE